MSAKGLPYKGYQAFIGDLSKPQRPINRKGRQKKYRIHLGKTKETFRRSFT